MNKLIIFILIIGVIYRLSITEGGNFIFNMDNARDMVDVREMVILKKLRLTGPTSAIEGLFNGPSWYYLLAIPFILSGGDPYSAIVMEIILWVVGGFFLLKLASRIGLLALLATGAVWIGSNYIVLTNAYAFNPNPVTLLTPLLIFLIDKYIYTKRLIFGFSSFFLGGLFFNFEMNAGVFIPLIIFFSILFSKRELLRKKSFWMSTLAFLVTIFPQFLFDLKHNFIMSKSVFRFLAQSQSSGVISQRILNIYQIFYNTLSATLMNQRLLTSITIALFLIYFIAFLRNREKAEKPLTIICFMFILVPFVGYVILPVQVNPWHLGAPVVAAVLLLSIILSRLKFNLLSRGVALIIFALIIFFATSNIVKFYTHDRFIKSQDPSEFNNEIAAIDYVYKYADGKNFKAYTYLPSVYDYPYQYLFWWYGQKKYGFIPAEYVYSPNKPTYIPSQEKFQGKKDNLSKLVFLIKEPDRIKMRQAWEEDFKDMEFVSKEMVGPLEVEIRREVKR